MSIDKLKVNLSMILLGTIPMGCLLGFLEVSTYLEKVFELKLIGITELNKARLYYPILILIGTFGFYGLYNFKDWLLHTKILVSMILLIIVLLYNLLIVNLGDSMTVNEPFQIITRGVVVTIFLFTILSIGVDLMAKRKSL